MIIPDGAVSKPGPQILPTDKIIGVDSRGMDMTGMRYWVVPHGLMEEER